MKNLIFTLTLLVLASCGGDSFRKSAVDELALRMDNEKNFTIILYDMDVEGTFSHTYKHRYKIIVERDTTKGPEVETTDWIEVGEREFALHENDMGMEICSKTDGVLSKTTSPPGYSHYVGNQRYGSWQTDSGGNSFWAFYGQYAFMSSMIGLMTTPIYRTSYMDYNSNYRGSRPYYGSVDSYGRPAYGTHSTLAQQQNPDFQKRMQTNSALKNRVNTSVSRSTSTSRSGSRYSTTPTRSRSSSRGGK